MKKETNKKIPSSWYLLILMLFVYLILFFTKRNLYQESLQLFTETLIKILPIFVLIFVLMFITNYFITNAFILKHLSGKGFKKWFFVILGGILSSGPIYMWYPLLSDLKKNGLSNGLISCFLYNRAIKIPLIPLAIIYFSWKYIITLLVVMIFTSILQAFLIDSFLQNRKRS